MSAKGTLGFIVGGIIGAAAGVVAGVMLAPRSGAESRAMTADVVTAAWDSAVDSYERGSRVVMEKINNVRPGVDATSDELRAKVDLARERMDQLRNSLSDVVGATSAQVQDAVNTVADKVTPTEEGEPVEPVEPVHVEVAGGDEDAAAEAPKEA